MATTPHADLPARASASFGAGRIALIVSGALMVLVALALLAAGGFVSWANATQRDAEGFFSSSSSNFTSDGFAITSEDIQLVHGVPRWLSSPGDVATFRAQGRMANGKLLFVGIAPAAAIGAYLRGVAHDEVVDVSMDGWRGPLSKRYRPQPGGQPAGPPGAETFWSARATGSNDVSLVWPVRQGTWSIVVMNVDGSRGVAAELSLGVKVRFLGWVTFGLLSGGSLLLLLGGAMVWFGVRSPSAAAAAELAAERRADP